MRADPSALFASSFSDFLLKKLRIPTGQAQAIRQLIAELLAALEDGHSCLLLSGEEEALLAPLFAAGLAGRGEGVSALVLWHGRLYLHRDFRYEKSLAHRFKAMAKAALLSKDQESSRPKEPCSSVWLREHLALEQQQAVDHALDHGLSVITGGPGTGKTTTVVGILIHLRETLGDGVDIALAAPTGKAAQRLGDSVAASLNNLPMPQKSRVKLPTQALTLHRLLGARGNLGGFSHDLRNPLSHDVVVVDEASMVDLALMAKLVLALKEGARLILLGDKDQLASVESGSVLRDLVAGLPQSTVELKTTFRFSGAIAALAEAVRIGDFAKLTSLLADPGVKEVTIIEGLEKERLGLRYLPFMQMAAETDPLDSRRMAELFHAFAALQILCALHYGQWGVVALNEAVEKNLVEKGFDCNQDWYQGRPVLLTKNDHDLQLYNGDIGIALYHKDSGQVKIWFQREDGVYMGLHPSRLPPHQTAFAMTIHKSQGSEFGEVIVVLPVEDSRILAKELLYTAITRARERVFLMSGSEILEKTVMSSSTRQSGLYAMLLDGRERNGG